MQGDLEVLAAILDFLVTTFVFSGKKNVKTLFIQESHKNDIVTNIIETGNKFSPDLNKEVSRGGPLSIINTY